MIGGAFCNGSGAFDEDRFAYGDHAELGLRARIAGWRCIYTPRAVVRRLRSSTLGVASWEKIALIERNRVLLAVRHFPISLLWRNGFHYALRLWEGVRAAKAKRFLSRHCSWAAAMLAAMLAAMGTTRGDERPQALTRSSYISGRRSRKNCQVLRTSAIISRSMSAVRTSSLSRDA